MYSGYYGSAPTIQLFIMQLFTIQEWTSFTPGMVYYCIIPYIVLSQLFSSLLYSYLLLIRISWQGYIMYSALYTSAPTIQLFIMQLFTIQKPIVLLFTIQKYSWQGCIMYSEYCILILIIQLLTVHEYVIQKCVIFTPGRVYNCIVYII